MTAPSIGFIQRWAERLRGPITRERIIRYLRNRVRRLSGAMPLPAAAPSPAPAQSSYPSDYPGWIAYRIRARRAEYQATPDRSLFSIMTPVYDTPPAFLTELAKSVFAQDFPFQWAISDDGSRNPQTLEVLEWIRQDPRVSFVRLERNSGITAATRAAFEIATGRYIIPVDADDLLYADALRVMAACLEQAGWPVMAYSDEDKVMADSVPINPFIKPDWDPVLFLNCCYIAHLCAISREAALAVDAYTDHGARGCPDLDTFCRLLGTGETPLHVPEILYSWRIHAGSTASFADRAKPYTIECQKHVWGKHLARLAPPDRLELRANPLFGHVGMWYPARRHAAPRPLHLVVSADGAPEQLRQCLMSIVGESVYPNLQVRVAGFLTDEHCRLIDAAARLAPHGSIAPAEGATGALEVLRSITPQLAPNTVVGVLSDRLRLKLADWGWEATGVFDLHKDAVACAPRLWDAQGLLASAGEHFGLGGLVGPPDRGRSPLDSGYHGWVFCQHTVSALPSDFFFCRADYLQAALPLIPEVATRALLGAWLGTTTEQLGGRIVYTPFVLAQTAANPCDQVQPGNEEMYEFVSRAHRLLVRDPVYSRFLHLRPGHGYQIALPRERSDILNITLSRNEGPDRTFFSVEAGHQEYDRAGLDRQLARRRLNQRWVRHEERETLRVA